MPDEDATAELRAAVTKINEFLNKDKPAEKEEPKKEQPEKEAKPDKHAHQFEELKDGSLFCDSCDKKFSPIQKVTDIVASLNKTYHRENHDFLGCKECRGEFVKGLNDNYEVKDKDGELYIKPKRK